MDKKFIQFLNHEKNTVVIDFFQNVQKIQKMFGIIKMTTVKFSLKSKEEIYYNLLNYRGASTPISSLLKGTLSPHPWASAGFQTGGGKLKS